MREFFGGAEGFEQVGDYRGYEPDWEYYFDKDRIYERYPAGIKKFIRQVIKEYKKEFNGEIMGLIHCEIDCIKNGNTLTPLEQEIALKALGNLSARIEGNKNGL